MKKENTKIILLENDLTIEERRNNLKELYDVMNSIGKKLFDNGIDVSKYFYTQEQYNSLLKNSKEVI